MGSTRRSRRSLNLGGMETVLLAGRKDAVRPRNGSKADVRHVLAVASKHFDELIALLEK